MKTQKIIKVGNSLAITLPASFVKLVKLKAGETVAVDIAETYKAILIKPTKVKNKINLSLEFFDWLNNFTEKNKELIRELANIDHRKK